MAACYSTLFPLLFLLVIIHWINSASLRSPFHQRTNSSLDRRNSRLINHHEYSTQETVLSRRRPHLPLLNRRRRWAKNENNDEVEIPIDENLFEPLNSSQSTVRNSIILMDDQSMNSTIIEFFTTEANNSTMNLVNATFAFDFIENSTLTKEMNSTSFIDLINVTQFNENFTLETNTNRSEVILLPDEAIINNVTESIVPLLRQGLVTSDENATTNSASEPTTSEIVEQSTEKNDNSTIPSLFIDSISTLSNETIAADSATLIGTTVNDQASSESITGSNSSIALTTIVSNEETSSSSNDEKTSTVAEGEPDTAIILLDHTIFSYNDTENLNTPTTNGDGLIIHDKTETFSFNDTSTTPILNNSNINTLDELSNATIIAEVSQNETLINTFEDVNEDGVSSNETTILAPKSTTIPVCERTCQCTKQCPYGFELLNDTCECKPPCENFQCFGNDTCEVTKKGQPVCRPENGTEHDRPLRCYQPRDSGHHDDSIRYYNRWYYHPDQDTCHLFVYRGLGGNENNFQTLHECHVECITCASALDPGTCFGHIQMWHYDYKKRECSQFEYSGCKGNENKFIRKQECIDTCVTRILNII